MQLTLSGMVRISLVVTARRAGTSEPFFAVM